MDSGCASTRVTASVPLPAPNGTTMVTGFCGKFSAPAAKPGHSSSAKAQTIDFMFPLARLQTCAARFVLVLGETSLLTPRAASFTLDDCEDWKFLPLMVGTTSDMIECHRI